MTTDTTPSPNDEQQALLDAVRAVFAPLARLSVARGLPYAALEEALRRAVVQAAAAPTGGFDAIVSMQISAFEADQVHLGSVGGPRLNLTAPPYELLADV